jgi:malate dehydrogenase
MKNKIGVVGTGCVGSEAANEIVRANVGDCVLVDLRVRMAHAKALDLAHSAPIRGSSAAVTDGGDYASLKGCDVVILSAGVARKPGMSRDDLLETNTQVMMDVIPRVMGVCPEAILLVVTNPLDAMTYAAWRLSGRHPRSVIGMACLLDSTRLRSILAEELGVSPEDVQAMVLGSHGDLMVPLARHASVAGIPVADLVGPAAMERMVERTKNAGTELVSFLESGSAFYAAGAAISATVDSIVNDKRRVLCSSILCRGEYGINGACVGVPAVIGARGVERILEVPLGEREKAALEASVEHVKMMQRKVDIRIAQATGAGEITVAGS